MIGVDDKTIFFRREGKVKRGGRGGGGGWEYDLQWHSCTLYKIKNNNERCFVC